MDPISANMKRVSIREFRASLRADMELPIIVTADGMDRFAVVSFDMISQVLNRPVEMDCPHWRGKVRPQSVQGRCPFCRNYLNVRNNGTAAGWALG